MIPLFTEVSREIGTGHIMESFALVQLAQASRVLIELWINKDAPEGLVERAPCQPQFMDVFSPERLSEAGTEMWRQGARLAVTNFRLVSNEQVHALQDCGLRVVCIDDFGNRQLDCDVVINPTMVSEQHRYTSGNPRTQIHTGLNYLTLGREYQELHDRPRSFRGPVKEIVVAMGGSDFNGATLKVVKDLSSCGKALTFHVVVGAAFKDLDTLKPLLDQDRYRRFRLYENVPSLAPLLIEADLGITAGGNTLSEMACVGTPALVLFDEEHEGRQGSAFQEAGAARCLGQAAKVLPGDIRKAVEELDDPQRRQSMAQAGRALVDGRGAERVLALLQEFK